VSRAYRWKLVDGKLPLYERHLRSLAADGVGAPLCSWIRSRMEWTFDNRRIENLDGVLCLVWRDDDTVDITDEPARELPDDLDGIGLVWTVYGDRVVPATEPLMATETLTRDLCNTLGFEVVATAPADAEPTEAFITSDEFGFIAIGGEGPVCERLSGCFEKLWSLGRDEDAR